MSEMPIILIVDDNPTNLSVLFEYLEESGYEIAVARSGENAIQQLEHVQPGLILLDILLPGIDGFETCRRLKANPDTKDIPIIFITALTDEIDKVKGFLAGGEDYITKPFHHEEVLVRINSHLTIRQLQIQIEDQQDRLNKQEEIIAQKDRKIQGLLATEDNLLSCISNELQHPLNSLLGFARLIHEHIDDYSREEIISNVQRLRHTAEELHGLNENLLMWLKIQRGSIEYQPKPVAIDEIVAYNILAFSSEAEQKGIAVRSSLQEKTIVYADYNMLNAVIRNLLVNVMKFTAKGGTINVSVNNTETSMEISISNSQNAVNSGHLAQLVEQLASNQSISCKDTSGLGLLLCKSLVEKHGGTMWSEGQSEKGAIITVSLPNGQETR